MSTVMTENRSSGMTPLLRALGGLLAAVVCLAALLPLFEDSGALPGVTKLEIAGEFKHLDPVQIRTHLQPEVMGSLWSLNLDAVRAAAERLPWVAQARVERLWPDGVRVSVREHIPYARWGERALLAGSGTVFTPTEKILLVGLPQLAGPSGQHERVLQTFRDLSAQIGASDFIPVSLKLDERGAWTAYTRAGVELRLGRGDPLSKTALINGAVAPSLGARLAQINYVDLRYTNGFAVGWRALRDNDQPGMAGPGGAGTTEVSPRMAEQSHQGEMQ